MVMEGPTEGPSAQGLWDPQSPIAVRVHTLGLSPPLDDDAILDSIMAAVRRRRGLIDPAETTAYRLCYGEGDRVPGFVLDRYGPVVVARLDGAAAEARFEAIAPRLHHALASVGVQTLARRCTSRTSGPQAPSSGHAEHGAPKGRLDHILGEPPPDTIDALENGMHMRVDLAQGQKTGAFLDQRDNRARVRAMSSGRRVLNLFSYAGGFSIAAALGGASEITSVDIAHRAHLTAQQSVRANGLDPARHHFVTADVYSFLEAAAREGHTWDLVISDPPSFAHSEKACARAIAAYRRLHRACAAVMAQGGILCAASCSSHIDQDTFLTTLDDRSLGRSDLCLVGIFGLPCDHPTTPAWAEGRYLKFAVLR